MLICWMQMSGLLLRYGHKITDFHGAGPQASGDAYILISKLSNCREARDALEGYFLPKQIKYLKTLPLLMF